MFGMIRRIVGSNTEKYMKWMRPQNFQKMMWPNLIGLKKVLMNLFIILKLLQTRQLILTFIGIS